MTSAISSTPQKRIEWIDEFKGFVLLLVCLFHIEQSFKSIDMGMLHLSAFRMSAFFFISGVLFSTRRFSTFKSYAVHKSKVLLIPYILLSLLFLALDPVIYNFDWFPRAPRMSVMTIRPVIQSVSDYIGWNMAKIFIAGKSSIGSGPIWFVFTLYSISLIFYGVQKIATTFAHRLLIQRIIIAIVTVICFAGGWLLYKNHIRLPLGIERDLTCLGFFAMGWLSKDLIKQLGNLLNKKKSTLSVLIVAAISISAFILYAFFEDANPYFSIMNNDLGKSLPKFILSSIFGIVGLVSALMLLSRIPAIAPVRTFKGILRNISRNALVILAVHWWVLLILRIIFKPMLDKPGVAYTAFPIVILVTIAAIPLFRCKLYKLIGKQKISVRESLSIK